MELDKIEELLKKYSNAETSLEEESQIRAYFAKNTIAPHLLHYKPLFSYLSQSKQELYSKKVVLTSNNKNKFHKIIAIAAATVLLTIVLVLPKITEPNKSEQQQALLAYHEAIDALSLVSFKINDSKKHLSSLYLIEENFNHSAKELHRLNEFTEAKKMLFNNN